MKLVASTLLALALVVAACGDDDTTDVSGTSEPPDGAGVEMPDREPDLTGTITVVTPFEPITDDCIPVEDVDPDEAVSSDDPPICTDEDSEVVGTILVEGDPAPERGRKISYTVTDDTKITGAGDGTSVRGFADLAPGQTADTWTTGPCAESYPEQCTLDAIRVTG